MRWQIPESFDLANRTYTVRWMTGAEEKKYSDEDGNCRVEEAQVLIRKGKHKDYRDHTFLHELMHAVFNAAGREKEYEDEGLVDSVAGLLHQFFKTKKGRLE